MGLDHKKILIIPSWYPNKRNELVGSFYREQAQVLKAYGYDIKVLYGQEERLSLFRFLKKLFSNKISLNQSFLVQDPEAFSFQIPYFKKWSHKKRLRQIKKGYLKAFQLLSATWKPDLIHAQSTANAGIYASFISENSKIPFVIIEHQIFILNVYKTVIQQEMIQALEKAKKVGAVSYHQQRCILMNNIHCEPEITWNLLDETKFEISHQKKDAEFHILSITYPHFIKDSETFFKAIQSFKSLTDRPFKVSVIGNDSFDDITKANSSTFKALARKYDVIEHCNFYPHLNREEIKEYLQECDVFVSTSIAETFGVAPREAMLCGKPVISTKNGGVEDSITPDTGILVNVKDYEGIARALLSVANGQVKFDPEIIRKFIIKQSGRDAFVKMMGEFYS